MVKGEREREKKKRKKKKGKRGCTSRFTDVCGTMYLAFNLIYEDKKRRCAFEYWGANLGYRRLTRFLYNMNTVRI